MCVFLAESYSVAGSEASIPQSAGYVPRHGSGSSFPCTHSPSGGSRHPVSALKKWLTNPVRKANPDAAGEVGKVEGEARGSERSHPPSPLISRGESQPRPAESPHYYAILPSGETVRAEREKRSQSSLSMYFFYHVPFVISAFIPLKFVNLQVIITSRSVGFFALWAQRLWDF